MALDVIAAEESQYCDDCPFRESPYVVGWGYSDTPFLVVGTGPGETEEATGLAFSGETGLLVRSLLEDLGLDLDSVYFTNVLKRRMERQRKPTARECWKCGSHLVHEIVRHRPRVVLALGSVPLDFLTSQPHSLNTVHGLPLPVERYGFQFRVVPTFDPSFIKRKGGLLSTDGSSFLDDLSEFVCHVRMNDYGED